MGWAFQGEEGGGILFFFGTNNRDENMTLGFFLLRVKKVGRRGWKGRRGETEGKRNRGTKEKLRAHPAPMRQCRVGDCVLFLSLNPPPLSPFAFRKERGGRRAGTRFSPPYDQQTHREQVFWFFFFAHVCYHVTADTPLFRSVSRASGAGCSLCKFVVPPPPPLPGAVRFRVLYFFFTIVARRLTGHWTVGTRRRSVVAPGFCSPRPRGSRWFRCIR